MKKMLFALLSAVSVATAFAAAPENWFTDYEVAAKRAAREKLPMLVLFTGSDWCPGCIALGTRTLSTAEFKEFAKKNLIPVYLDSPRNPPLTAAQRRKLAAASEKLQPGPYVPTSVVVSPEGKVLARIVGYKSAGDYIAAIKSALGK
ncbi:MAG: thioredoxin family protein [Lentisphaeria bacterium]|nr:thioredoxin family protein [Lentisphaeria bacterium]